MIGVDVAREIDRAIQELDCKGLIIDLRGTRGHGLASLRLMSYFTPGRIRVGYSVSRRDLDRPDFDEARLPQIDRVPADMIDLFLFHFRLAMRGWSTALFTEGKGHRRFHRPRDRAGERTHHRYRGNCDRFCG